MNSFIETHKYLLKYSIKPSIQRTAIMNFLLKNHIHPTVDEIYSALNPQMPTLSKTTVYNTLGLFAERGAVRVLTIDEKNARYDADVSAHAHFICNSCSKVFDFFNVDPGVFNHPDAQGFKINKTEISYSGLCPQCLKSN